MRRYGVPIVLSAVAVLLVALGLACLRISGILSVDAGYGAVAHLEAFGTPLDRDESQQAWLTARSFGRAGTGLLASSIPIAALAVWYVRRARGRRGSDQA